MVFLQQAYCSLAGRRPNLLKIFLDSKFAARQTGAIAWVSLPLSLENTVKQPFKPAKG
jgi:hypothetical protein